MRINLIKPEFLADQHLIAEFNEILMLVAHAKKHPNIIDLPKNFCLGKGHILFFKNKLRYLKNRHNELKKEMKKRGFRAKRSVKLKGAKRKLINDWKPKKRDKEIIKKRLIYKIKLKPNFYRYYSTKRSQKFLLDLIKNAK